MLDKIKLLAAVSAFLMLCSCRNSILVDESSFVYPDEGESSSDEMSKIPLFSDNGDLLPESDGDFSFDDFDQSFDTELPDYDGEDEIAGEEPEISEAEEDTEDKEDEEKEEKEDEESSGDEESADDGDDDEKEKKPAKEKDGRIPVPYLSQKELPTGCELVSAAMLLNYYDVNVEPMDLIEGGHLEAVKVEKQNGVLYGGDPNKVFVGDPKERTGYGCYSSALTSALKDLLKDDFFDVYDLSGMELSEICDLYIGYKQPVIIWGTINMEPVDEKDSTEWKIRETDEDFRWIAKEHCMVLVGYDDKSYYIHDPQKGEFTAYDRKTADKCYALMGKQAVTVIPW